MRPGSSVPGPPFIFEVTPRTNVSPPGFSDAASKVWEQTSGAAKTTISPAAKFFISVLFRCFVRMVNHENVDRILPGNEPETELFLHGVNQTRHGIIRARVWRIRTHQGAEVDFVDTFEPGGILNG